MTTKPLRHTLACTLVLACALPASTAAQQRESPIPEALRTSRVSLSFGLPSGGGAEIGVWFHTTPRVALGVALSGSFSSDRTGLNTQPPVPETEVTRWSIGGGPQLKWYFPVAPGVGPHLLAFTDVSYDWRETASDPAWDFGAAGGVGLGVDWFPTDRISIGGAATLGAGWFKSDNGSGGYTERLAANLGTTALRLQIYF